MHIKCVFIFCVFYSVNGILYSINTQKGPSETDWKQFKLSFNKTYETKHEDHIRHKIFKDNWINIQKHNKQYDKGQVTYLQEINRFSDLTDKEFSELYPLPEVGEEDIINYISSSEINTTEVNSTEDFLNWYEEGVVTPAKDQGHCGSCWAFCASELNKKYNSNQEERVRFKVFKTNWENIEKHNKQFRNKKVTFLQEMNKFGDLTDQEFIDIYGLTENDFVNEYSDDTSLHQLNKKEEYLNWRFNGTVTDAKDQGKCGSCWIFSAVGAVESYIYRKTGKLQRLSEQHVVDCYSNSSCNGGIPEEALDFMKESGVYLESDYPYNAKQNDCQNLTKTPLSVLFNQRGYVNVTTDDDLKEAVKKYGPMPICLYATAKWRFYKSGVWYDKECSEVSNHCVLLVGYGTENGNDYWLFKNSWGPKWGLDGFIKVARNKHNNYCGINTGNIFLI